MADFMKPIAQTEQRLGQYSMRLVRIEAHLRRGEKRAARAQMNGFVEELEEFRRNMEFPMQMTLVCAQLGLLSGKGPLIRGRLAAALVCGVGGWLYGNAAIAKHQSVVDDLLELAHQLKELSEAGVSSEQPIS